jgi:hypothetical protein
LATSWRCYLLLSVPDPPVGLTLCQRAIDEDVG